MVELLIRTLGDTRTTALHLTIQARLRKPHLLISNLFYGYGQVHAWLDIFYGVFFFSFCRPLVPANGQGYGQAGGNHGGAPHVGYPLGVMPFMGYPHPQQVILPYVAHSHQGEYQPKPQAPQKYFVVPASMDGAMPPNGFPMTELNELNYYHVQQAYNQSLMRPTPSSTPVNNNQATVTSSFSSGFEQSEQISNSNSNQTPVPLPTPPLSNMPYPMSSLSPAPQQAPNSAPNALQYYPFSMNQSQQSVTFVNRNCSEYSNHPFPPTSKTPVHQTEHNGNIVDNSSKMRSPDFSRNRMGFSEKQTIERPTRNFSPPPRLFSNAKPRRYSNYPRKNYGPQNNRPFRAEKDRVRAYD